LQLEVSTHETDVFGRPQLLELLAGRSPVARQMVDGANRNLSFACSFIGEMGAPFPGSIEDHGLRIIGIDAAVCQNGRRVDNIDIQMKAA
jgi:hypothetical protein